MYHRKSEVEFKNKLMEEVDKIPLPKDFNDWLGKYPFKNCWYMFFKIEGKGKGKRYVGACQHCKKENIVLDRVKNGKFGKCPICHKKVKYRYENFSKDLNDRQYVSLIKKVEEGYVESHFLVVKISNYLNVKFVFDEMERRFFTIDFKNGFYTEDWFREYNGNWTFGFYRNMYYSLPDVVWTYYKNLDMLCKGLFKYFPVKQLVKNCECSVFDFMIKFVDFPQLESLVKLKFFGLLRYFGFLGISNEINCKADNIKDFLGLNGQYYEYALKNARNLNCEQYKTLRFLQMLKIQDIKLNIEFADVLRTFFGSVRINEILQKISFESLKKYYYEVLKDEHHLRDYYDYLGWCDELKYNLNDTAYLKPKNFVAAHDSVKDKVLALRNKKKNENLKRVLKKLQELSFQYKDLCIVVPGQAKDLVDEGAKLHHCVGTYIDRVASSSSYIFFVRKIDKLDKSYYTLEINPENNELVQCRGDHNKQAPEEILKFIKKWQQEKLFKFNKNKKLSKSA